MFTILMFIYFFLVTFHFQCSINSKGYLNSSRVWSSCDFLFLIWLSIPMLCPITWPFIFRVLGFLYPIMAPVPILCQMYIALQEFQAVAFILQKMTFWLSGKVVALPLDNSTAAAHLCSQAGTAPPFLSKLACQILNLANRHGITLIPANIHTHLNVEAEYLSQGRLVPNWHLLSCIAQGCISSLGSTGGRSVVSLVYQSMKR